MFKFSLVTPDKKIVTDADLVDLVVPAFRGELNILPGHSPLMTTLSTGVLRYKLKDSDKTESAAISWGYCEVSPSGVNVLAETAETMEDVDKERAEDAATKAEAALKEPDLEPNQIAKFQRKLERARARIQITNK